ncbi:MAG: hypothetical protein J6M48_07685 [Ruminococcus sp.]|nr:hypothetical protein [Ruminococcus sp.]
MDSNNNVALSDAERNKELFEYEMTEVLLQLKGEFAKFSGKDLIAAEIQQIRPYSGGSVTRKTAEINDVSVRGITAVKIAEVKTDSKKIDVPQSIYVSPVKNIAVNVEKAKIDHDCPAIKTVEISPVTIRMTDRIAVPEKPVFSGEIQSILGSIV